jgi:hypothetical protein
MLKDMKKARLTTLLSFILIVGLMFMYAFCAGSAKEEHGPAPNSGDGIPDGSGYDRSNWQNDHSSGMGPAPNSCDGVPDGSGF